MKQKSMRLIAALLTLAMVMSVLAVIPFTASAVTDTPVTYATGTNTVAGTHVIPEGNATPPTVVTPETDTELDVYTGADSDVAPTEVDAEGYTLINSAAEFAYILKTAGCGDTAGNKYRLTVGIDLNKKLSFDTYSFAAELDGANHTLSNYGGNVSGDKTVGHGFFTTVTGTIKNLVITNITFNSGNWQGFTTGGFVGELGNGGVLDGIVIRTGSITGAHVGGIVGKIKAGEGGTATIRNCVIENTFWLSMATADHATINLGGVASTAHSGNITFENCYNFATPVKVSGTNISPFSELSLTGLYYGGILGFSEQSDACHVTIKKCVNVADFISPRTYNQYGRNIFAGGIVGATGHATITDCANYGNLQATGDFKSSLGGIAGQAPLVHTYNSSNSYPKFAYVEISNCVNYGTLSCVSESPSVGGIVGLVGDRGISITVNDSYNYGTLDIDLAPATHHASFGTSYNRGLNAYVGGVIGHFDSYKNTTDGYLNRCGNAGEIILELRTKQEVSVALPTDTSDVAVSLSLTVNYRVGGIVGRVTNNLFATDCTNLSDLSVNEIIEPSIITPAEGVNLTDVTEKYTTGTAYFGGTVGVVEKTGASILENCKNTGALTPPVSNKTYIGGIAGSLGDTGTPTLKNCLNTGDITAIVNEEAYAGGLFGRGISCTVSFTNCENRGNVTTSGNCTTIVASGFSGTLKAVSELTNCVNYGDITVSGESTAIGGFLATSGGNLVADNAVNYGNLTLNYKPAVGIVSSSKTLERVPIFTIGGLVGKISGTATISNSSNRGTITLNADITYDVPTALPADATTATYTIDAKTTITLYMGGAIGYVTGATSVENFINEHDLAVNQSATTAFNFSNPEGVTTTKGTVTTLTGTDYIGGIFGKTDTKDTITLTNCHNHGNLNAPGPDKSYVGGLLAYINSGVVIENSTNRGTLTANGKTMAVAGGFIGICPAQSTSSDLVATNSSNYGDVILTGYVLADNPSGYVCTQGRAGGFVGSMGAGGNAGFVDFVATNCGQFGNISAAVGDAGAAAVVGYTDTGYLSTNNEGVQIKLYNCYITGTVAGGSGSGGVLGYFNPTNYTSGSRHVDVTLENTYLVPVLVPHISDTKVSQNQEAEKIYTGGEGLIFGYSYKSGGSAKDSFSISNSYLLDSVDGVAQSLNYSGNSYNANDVTNLIKGKYTSFTDDMLTDGTVMNAINAYALTNTYTPWFLSTTAPELVTQISFSGATMTLGENMALNMKLAENAFMGLDNIIVTFVKNGEGTSGNATVKNGYYTVSYTCDAADLAKSAEYYIEVAINGTTYTSTNILTYAPIDYATALYNDEKHPETQDLIVKMLSMASLSEAKKYGAESTAIATAASNAGITLPAEYTIPENMKYYALDADKAAEAIGIINKFAMTGANLNGNVNLVFKVTDANVKQLRVTANGLDKTYAVKDGYITVTGLNASNIRNILTLDFQDETGTTVTSADGVAGMAQFSAGNYLQSVIANTQDTATKNLASAMVLYMMSVRDYALAD